MARSARRNDNAFVAVDDVTVLQAVADKLEFIRKRLDYWTFILGSKSEGRTENASLSPQQVW